MKKLLIITIVALLFSSWSAAGERSNRAGVCRTRVFMNYGKMIGLTCFYDIPSEFEVPKDSIVILSGDVIQVINGGVYDFWECNLKKETIDECLVKFPLFRSR